LGFFYTFLNLPSMKRLEIAQKPGSDEAIASDTFLTRHRTACHAFSPADFAIRVRQSMHGVISVVMMPGIDRPTNQATHRPCFLARVTWLFVIPFQVLVCQETTGYHAEPLKSQNLRFVWNDLILDIRTFDAFYRRLVHRIHSIHN